MDESDHNPQSNHQTQPAQAELTVPLEEVQEASLPPDASASPEIEAGAQADSVGSIPNQPRTSVLSFAWVERYWKLVLIVILLLGAGLRTRGLNWDEGQHLHPDERFLTMVETAIRLPASLSEYFDTLRSPLNPYNNNFSSFVYGTAPLFLVRLVGQLTGLVDYERMVLLGRALSALADVFVLAMTFFIARRLYGLRVGLLAALLYALSVLPIKQSHFFTVDTFTNVPLMLAFWFTLDIMEDKRRWRAFLLAGACFGLMLASRINLAPFLGVVGIAALIGLVRSLESMPHVSVRRDQGEAATSVTATGEPRPMRRFRLGPLLIEIEFKQDTTGGAAARAASPVPWKKIWPVLAGLILAVVVALLIFRIAQPYAFEGFFKLNPQFAEDMGRVQRLVSGEDDYPPSHQWTNRAPYWFFWYNLVVWGFGPALGLAAWLGVGLATFQVLRHRRWEHLPMLLWVLGLFFYHGQQFVMTMRYLMPLYPFLAIFAAFFLFEVWERTKILAQNNQTNPLARSARLLAGLLLGIVIGTTAFWAFASSSIYTRTNTRVAASRWIYDHVAEGEVIANEHWDDNLPLRVDGKDYFRDHQGVMLELYGEDTPEKRDQMVGWMDQTDYIILSSNRLYQSIPRLPMRFPLTTKYYDWLFNGKLGFERVQEFTSYPQFLGITIRDDNAEEAFTVYDHAKVIIFRKTVAYSHDNTVRLFNSVDLTEVLRLKPLDAAASRRQFRMSSVELAADRAGGTWSQIFYPNDLANQFPLLLWLLMVWVIGILAFPFTFVVFHSFADRGYAFAKALGILFVAWFAWTLSSYHLVAFGRLALLSGIALMIIGAVLIWRRSGQELRLFLATRGKVLLIEELVFLGFFALDLFIRFRNPDLWHPWLGGERPMDFAFLNAILKSTYFPPYNPWFAGNYINYYYFGQLISAALVRLSGIIPEVAYNLLIPLFFGLTASSAFGVVFNLVFSGRQRLMPETPSSEEPQVPGLRAPTLAGLFGVILVLIIGNLGQIKLAYKGLTELAGGTGLNAFLTGLNKWLADGQTIPVRIGDWYWTATRVIPDTINEFPFFTFIYGDLHAHLIAIPFALVALGLAAHILLNRNELKWLDMGIIALILGSLRAINTWDYPTYLGIIGAALILRWSDALREQNNSGRLEWPEWLQQWLRFILVAFLQVMLIMIPLSILRIRVNVELIVYVLLLLAGIVVAVSQAGRSWDPYQFLKKFSWQFLPIVVLSVLLYLPYVINYATGYASVELWQGTRTTFNEYLTVHGIFLFLTATFLITVVFTNYLRGNSSNHSGFEMTGWAIYFVPALVIASLVLAVLKFSILALTLPLLGLGIWIILHHKTPTEAVWVSVLMVIGLLLTLMVEAVTLKGDVGRMNTVFKFYLQAWVLFGVASAAGLGLTIKYLTSSQAVTAEEAPSGERPAPASSWTTNLPRLRWAWWGLFSVLILAGLLYPISAARAKMNDRYVENSPPGLNGMDYMQGATYFENNRELVLRWDQEAIQWIRENIPGSPVIMEANTGLYRWGDRYSIYTGLPTVIGWDWHTKQQYSLLPSDLIDSRVALVQEFYNTPDSRRAKEIADRYGVSYVVVGGLERAVYDANGLAKFDLFNEDWTLVHQNEQVNVYKVR
jgi:uncharacterized membrane protein/4-amino-4-deoxy-L-arabinose transferase-like glycosyltransferase